MQTSQIILNIRIRKLSTHFNGALETSDSSSYVQQFKVFDYGFCNVHYNTVTMKLNSLLSSKKINYCNLIQKMLML